MLTLNEEQVTKILTSELGYRPGQAEYFVRSFPPVHGELSEAVNRWLQDRTILDTKVYGISLQEVMQIKRCNFLNAVKSLNRLLDNDIGDKRRDQMLTNLRIPFPRW
jgi:hypothetical protein